MPRSDDLQFFLDELKTSIAKCQPAQEIQSATTLAFQRLETLGQEKWSSNHSEAPATAWLEQAIKTGKAGPTGKLADALENLAPKLFWQRRMDRPSIHPKWPNSHANSVIIGDTGLECRNDVRIGVSLLAPYTIYPNHQHPPEEVYIALSNGSWRQNDGFWQTRGAGGLIYNPPNIVHAMKSNSDPLLAIWILPLSLL